MTISDNPRLEKSRTVKSRYLSPISAAEPPPPSPNHNLPLSPNHHQKPKSSLKKTGLLRGVWPSSTPHSSKSHNENIPITATATSNTTLADYLGSDRKKDAGGGPNVYSVFSEWKKQGRRRKVLGSMTFKAPDNVKYPSMDLAYAAGRAGGTMTGVLSAANEKAVEMFLDEKISYLDIFKVVELTCEKHQSELVRAPSLEEIIHYDLWAREYAANVKTLTPALV